MTQTKEHIYFIGIGGISMSGLAEILASRGHQVSGTDVKETAVTKHLQSLGIHINFGHRAENITDDITLGYTPRPSMTTTRNCVQPMKKASV